MRMLSATISRPTPRLSGVASIYNSARVVGRATAYVQPFLAFNVQALQANNGAAADTPARGKALAEAERCLVFMRRQNGRVSPARDYGAAEAFDDCLSMLYADGELFDPDLMTALVCGADTLRVDVSGVATNGSSIDRLERGSPQSEESYLKPQFSLDDCCLRRFWRVFTDGIILRPKLCC